MTFIKYSLTRGLAFGLLMTFFEVFSEAIENGFGSISLETLYNELYWIPFGILVFGPFFWWSNKRSGKDK